jgi:hypothetical protein
VPWIFTQTHGDARGVDLSPWSRNGYHRYKTTFQALRDVPLFESGLFENGCELDRRDLDDRSVTAQADAILTFLRDLLMDLNLEHPTGKEDGYFCLLYVTGAFPLSAISNPTVIHYQRKLKP